MVLNTSEIICELAVKSFKIEIKIKQSCVNLEAVNYINLNLPFSFEYVPM